MFQFEDVAQVLAHYLSKSDNIFMPGCGNAPLSPDMYDAGYTNQLNCDTSDIVIQQMDEFHNMKRPGMKFAVMDATDTGLESGSFDAVVDKSLIDTLLCCDDSIALTTQMVDEFHRLLKPGGVYITMSLHDEHDTINYFKKSCYNWVAGHVYLKNPNYEEEKQNTKYYLVAVCKKHGESSKLDEAEFLNKLSQFDQLAVCLAQSVDEESPEFESTVQALSLLNAAFKAGLSINRCICNKM